MSVSVDPLAGSDPGRTLAELLAGHDSWGGRDTRHLLYPHWFRL